METGPQSKGKTLPRSLSEVNDGVPHEAPPCYQELDPNPLNDSSADQGETVVAVGTDEGTNLLGQSVTYDQAEEGVVSYDPALNDNPELLLQFISQHSQRPGCWVEVEGYHLECSPTTQTTSDWNSWSRTETDEQEVRVVDFSTQIDITELVSSTPAVFVNQTFENELEEGYGGNDDEQDGTRGMGRRIHQAGTSARTALRRARGRARRTLHDVARQYATSTHRLKELKIRKKVQWDFQRVKDDVEQLFRSRGYRHHIDTRLVFKNHHISIRSPHPVMKLYHNRYVGTMSFMSCLWPMFSWMRQLWDEDLSLDYVVNTPPERFVTNRRNEFLQNIRFS
ncbi:hypothetical protein IWQ62_003883 [Dispira parvispora]|uniref:Uncharacterized protein n=1 Tax=Dispira parvispora TaxID=1520584 RepID=A0A9W8AU01_9FUNG|nr:hypothetical protein IWQ62_003883 [Dispira parvispora]